MDSYMGEDGWVEEMSWRELLDTLDATVSNLQLSISYREQYGED